MRAGSNQMTRKAEAGFSLLEMTIAMTITLILLAGATKLLTVSLGTRTRENQRSDALADAQRAINIMSREIGNSGYGMLDNGIVVADSSATRIRIRANVHPEGEQYVDPTKPVSPGVKPLATDDVDEDVTYYLQNNALVRYDKFTNTPDVLADRINSLDIQYKNASGSAVSISSAVKISITVTVSLPAAQGQPASQVRLSSDVALRNSPSLIRQY